MNSTAEHIDTLVIGGGQAGLSVGYHLKRRGVPHLILDANERVGDTWRNRWDSLRLFTPARYNGLDGMRFPAGKHDFVTKDAMADFLEDYARRFELPVRNGSRVERLSRADGKFVAEVAGRRIVADHVVVAMGNYQVPHVPEFACRLDREILQLHSLEYRSPQQLRPGRVLLVGAGNSGAEIAKELSSTHETLIAGRDVGQIPFRVSSFLGLRVFAPVVLKFVFHRVLTTSTPMGRKMRPQALAEGGPLIRVKGKELSALGVQRTGRVAGAKDGKPMLDDGTVLDVSNVIWCTGFKPGFSWIELPVHGEVEPKHRRGVVETEPGLYFVGLEFQHAMSSGMVQGVGRDARYVVDRIARARGAA